MENMFNINSNKNMCWLYQYQIMYSSEQKILPEIKRENL